MAASQPSAAMETSIKPPAAVSSTLASVNDPSHHSRHHSKNKKGSDPFLELTDADIDLSNLTSPRKEPENENNHSDSIITDLLLTPLTMISFLLSLSLVDRQQRQWRLSQHSSAASVSFWSRFTSWLGPEPYQDSNEATWKHSSNEPAQSGDANTFRGFYTRKKHRAMAKMEIGDAFEMRRRVLLAFAAWTILGFFALTYATRRMYSWIVRG